MAKENECYVMLDYSRKTGKFGVASDLSEDEITEFIRQFNYINRYERGTPTGDNNQSCFHIDISYNNNTRLFTSWDNCNSVEQRYNILKLLLWGVPNG